MILFQRRESTRDAVLRRVGIAPLPKARDVVKVAERIVRAK